MCDADKVAWEVEFTHQFEDWWNGLDEHDKDLNSREHEGVANQ
jgi:hypothetical protein